LRYDVSKLDHSDFWILKEQKFWESRGFWFRQTSSFLALLFLFGIAFTPLAIYRAAMRSDPK
jgi:hypothetical protein